MIMNNNEMNSIPNNNGQHMDIINREYYTYSYILVDDRLWLYTDEKEIAVKFKI